MIFIVLYMILLVFNHYLCTTNLYIILLYIIYTRLIIVCLKAFDQYSIKSLYIDRLISPSVVYYWSSLINST